MLSACGKSDATDDNNRQNGVVEETNNEEESKETTKISNPSGIEEIFLKAADAMDRMQGMMLTGKIITTSDIMDIVENSTTQVTATLSANG